jgi:IS5 family transposase
MKDTGQPPLPEWVQAAYEALESAYTADTDELSRTAAHELLLDGAEQVETDGDAEYVLDRLLDRGWLYEVNGQLRKTE